MTAGTISDRYNRLLRTIFNAGEICHLDPGVRQHMIQMLKPRLDLRSAVVDSIVPIPGKSNKNEVKRYRHVDGLNGRQSEELGEIMRC